MCYMHLVKTQLDSTFQSHSPLWMSDMLSQTDVDVLSAAQQFSRWMIVAFNCPDDPI